ncbi:nucleotidyl transferase AbiEii/AbiGii toxin family protein [Pseudokineococcus basanitobsidens]|uniref:Nucleotidyl transferase AbiEii/AbiGii toxin family protein n=1 Tax=Pseudokineococcus basanitobsidens TaxID=1926649 RepID=A0ABU8RF36_9ACTN
MRFVGAAMAAVVHGIEEVRSLTGTPPVVVGGLAVLARLSTPYRATVDLDVVDRRRGEVPQLELLRGADGARSVDPTAVVLPTPYGDVTVDVLEVRQIELDEASDDPGDRLHAAAHAWAFDTATDVEIEVTVPGGAAVTVTTSVAEPGPLVAMKLQAVMDRGAAKAGTDLHDIVHHVTDPATRQPALRQVSDVRTEIADDIAWHVEH